MIKIFSVISMLVLVSFYVVVPFVLAEVVPGKDQKVTFTVPNWLIGEPKYIVDVFDMVAKWILNVSIPIAVALIIWGGILYMTAGTKPANVAKAQNIFKQVAIGLVVIFIGKGFISLVKSILEMN